MPLRPEQRRALIARSHELQPSATISADQLTDSVIEHLRALLRRRELAKVRVRTDDRAECDRVAAELAALVPCEVVTRIGRVVLLYRPKEAAGEEGGSVV